MKIFSILLQIGLLRFILIDPSRCKRLHQSLVEDMKCFGVILRVLRKD